jgi:hypothetical protein
MMLLVSGLYNIIDVEQVVVWVLMVETKVLGKKPSTNFSSTFML